MREVQRFWKYAQRSHGCWEWNGPRDSKGYGFLMIDRKLVKAHRFSWMLLRGSMPGKMCVCHTCDNRSCVNPDHLFLVTNEDNQRDKVAKNRQAKGHRIGTAKLNGDQARKIMKRVFHGESYRSIARDYGVSFSTIYLIAKQKNWKHIFEEV